MKNWYIVQAHSNFENKVAMLIKEEAKKSNISEKIEAIIAIATTIKVPCKVSLPVGQVTLKASCLTS